MEITVNVNINAPELSAAILSLASALSATAPRFLDSVEPAQLPFEKEAQSKSEFSFNLQDAKPAPQPAPVQAPTTQAPTASTPVSTTPAPVQTPTTSATVPTTPAPVQAPTTTQTPATAVPTTTQTYTMEQLAVAATQLVDAGRREELVQLLQQFGVQALTALPKEQYGAFATALRQMGAKI